MEEVLSQLEWTSWGMAFMGFAIVWIILGKMSKLHKDIKDLKKALGVYGIETESEVDD